MDFIQPQRTFRVQPSRIQRDQFLHVGLEHVLGHDDEQQGAQRAACYRNDHVLRVIDGHAGHVFIRAEYAALEALKEPDLFEQAVPYLGIYHFIEGNYEQAMNLFSRASRKLRAQEHHLVEMFLCQALELCGFLPGEF